MEAQKISLRPYYWRFAWVHFALSAAMLGIAFLHEWMTGSDLPSGSGASMAILVGTAYAAMHKFVTCEGRAPAGRERWRLVGGSLAIIYLMALAYLVVIFLFVAGGDLLLAAELFIKLAAPGAIALFSGIMLITTAITAVFLMLIYGPIARKLATKLGPRPVAA